MNFSLLDYKKYFLSFFFGALLSLSLPPYNFTIISFLVFPCFLYLLFSNQNKHAKFIFFIGFSFGYGYFLSNIYWITYSLNFDTNLDILKPLVLIFIPSILAIFYGLICAIIKKFISNKIYFVVIFSVALSLADFLRGFLFTGFPWNLFVYTWSWSIETIQVLGLIGTYSFNFLSIFVFSLPFIIFFNFSYKKLILTTLILLSILLTNFYYGSSILKQDSLKKISNFKVVVLQPDQNIDDLRDIENQENYINRLIEVSSPGIFKNQETLFVWPEGVFHDAEILKQYSDLFEKNFSLNHKIILGSTRHEQIEFYNSLLLLNNKAEVISSYDKIKLVPFGEFMPFHSFFEKMNLKKITFGYGSFSKGEDRHPIEIRNDIKFLPLICYEIIFSGLLDKEKKYYNFILNISEDGWFGRSIGTNQHFVHSQYRAIEQGKHVIRSSNQGISASIKPNGVIDKKTNFISSSFLIVDIYEKNSKTLFSVYENKIFHLLILLTSILVIFFRKINE
jgi:apolipoprotein N-acyltransferase